MVHILSLATATPPIGIGQDKLASKIASASNLNDAEKAWLERVFRNSAIEKRYSVLEEFSRECDGESFWKEKIPTTQTRNEIYKKEAPKLSLEAAKKALTAWGGDPQTITHLIFVSCTGIMAPGVQAILQQELSLSSTVNQFGLNMMGCFGAFKGLNMAYAFAKLNPQNRILLVCTELCSLHFQQSNDRELQIGNAIFADGSAACVVGECVGKSLCKIEKFASSIVPNTLTMMTWEVSDCGFRLGLKKEVPQLLKEHLAPFLHHLLPSRGSIDACAWPIHPGGKEILRAIQEALDLPEERLAASWSVLKQYGNMSSPTFLFVLEALKIPQQNWAVGLGFGPGLTLEGILLNYEESLS